MTIKSDIQSLDPGDLITLYTLDLSPIGQPDTYHFHPGVNGLNQPIVWQGVTYQPFPIEAEGFEMTTKGTLPRPRIRISNLTGLISALVREQDDLVGAKVIRKRTFARYLDAVNFPNGLNPDADPNQEFFQDIFYIEQKTLETREVIEWELVSVMDLQGVMLPRRQITSNACMWRYRSSECSYTGTNYFDAADNPVGSASQDVCGKRLSSCKARFGANAELPFGGFPGALRY